MGLRFAALDAALALAELDLRQGNPAAGRQALQSLQDEALRQVFALIADRAQGLLGVTSPRQS